MFHKINDYPKYAVKRVTNEDTDYVIIRHEDGIHHEDIYMRMDTFDRMVASVYGQP